MAKKRQKITLFDLGRIPITEVKNTSGYEDSRTLWNRLKQEEIDAATAPERVKAAFAAKLQADLDSEIAAANAELTAFWSQPLDAMRSDKAIADSVGFAFGDYTLRNGAPVTDGPEVLQAFDKFLTERGIRLTNRAAFERLRRFMEVNVAHGASCSVENWFRSLERLAYLVPEFAQSVEGYTVPVVTAKAAQPAQPREETEAERRARIAAEIEHGSRNNEIELVNLEMRREWQNMYRQFAEFMQTTYNVDVLQQRIVDFAVKWAEKWNKNLADPTGRTLNELRRALDYQQLLGPRGRLLTADERLAQSLEDTPLTTADFATRQDVVSRLREMGKVG